MAESNVFQHVCEHIDKGFSILAYESREFLKKLVQQAMADAYERGQQNATIHEKNQELVVPIVNLNGTSNTELFQQYLQAMEAVQKALDALRRAAPHGRDYPIVGSYALARQQFNRQFEALDGVRKQLEEIAMKIRPTSEK